MCAVRDKSYVRHISKPHLRWFTRIRRVDHRCMSSRSSREHQLDRSLCLTWKNLRPAENFQHLHLPTYNNVLLVIDGIKFIQGTAQMIFDYVHLYHICKDLQNWVFPAVFFTKLRNHQPSLTPMIIHSWLYLLSSRLDIDDYYWFMQNTAVF